MNFNELAPKNRKESDIHTDGLWLIEKELTRRLQYPYHWGRKQSDDWDEKTNFIYDIQKFDDLFQKISHYNRELKDYAMNRWFNFWSAMGVEKIFAMHPNVTPNENRSDKLFDFTIDGVPFDHKTSVFPRGFGRNIGYALRNKKELIHWLYRNQSQQGRKHLKNRLFVVLYNKTGEHWKMKAELTTLKKIIDNYMKSFNIRNLVTLDFGEGKTYSDIIWFVKK